jgi:hypothetical protein
MKTKRQPIKKKVSCRKKTCHPIGIKMVRTKKERETTNRKKENQTLERNKVSQPTGSKRVDISP